MAAKIAINGFGRIGRQIARNYFTKRPNNLELVAVNDLSDIDYLSLLLKHDTNHGTYTGNISISDNSIIVNGSKLLFLNETNPRNLPWKKLDVDIVIECTGTFNNKKDAISHITAGAKKVIIAGTAIGEDLNICMGVNQTEYNPAIHNVICNGSCTTNCVGPVIKVINDSIGINNCLINFIHSYTNEQRLLDVANNKDVRRARSATMNIIPTTTTAERGISLVIPELEGKIHAIAMRVPTPVVHAAYLVAQVRKVITKEDLLLTFEAEASGAMKGILTVSYDPLVSIDYKGNYHSSIIDAEYTMVHSNLIQIVVWHDNETAYSSRLLDLASYIAK